MPHCVKKIANAFERSGQQWRKTDLKFRGKQMSLQMIRKLWIASDGGPNSTSLRMSKLTEAHFTKDGYSRMRCFLAFQVMSATVVRLIDDYADYCGGMEFYIPLREIVVQVDTLVDIMNSNVEKGFQRIDSPNHPHLDSLISVMQTFSEWHQEAKNNGESNQFVPETTYQDICWLVFGTFGLSKYYLAEDKRYQMAQDRHGSDVCENHFANIKNRNSNPTKLDADNSCAKSTNTRSNLFSMRAKTNTAGQVIRRDELFIKMEKVK
jgi:hypothetical protein